MHLSATDLKGRLSTLLIDRLKKNYVEGSQLLWFLVNPMRDPCETQTEYLLQHPELYDEHNLYPEPPAQFAMTVTIEQIVHELFDLPSRVAHTLIGKQLQEDPFGDIDKDDWLCSICLREFVRQRLWAWWHLKKRERGFRFQPDCLCVVRVACFQN